MDLKKLTKKELSKLAKKIDAELKSRDIEIDDKILITFNYMIGDADGNYKSDLKFLIESEDHLNALKILQHTIETEVMGVSYAKFSLNSYNLENLDNKIPYQLFIEQDEAPSTYLGYEINEVVLECLYEFYDELFTPAIEIGTLLLTSMKFKVL